MGEVGGREHYGSDSKVAQRAWYLANEFAATVTKPAFAGSDKESTSGGLRIVAVVLTAGSKVEAECNESLPEAGLLRERGWSLASEARVSSSYQGLTMNIGEKEFIRQLAERVAEIAASPENAKAHKRWCDVNALRKPDRAPVYCRPVGAWNEILPEESLECTEPWLRSVERNLKMTLIKHEISDDTPFENYYSVSAAFDFDPPSVWGVDIRHHHSDDPGGAWAYDPPLKTDSDFEKLKLPSVVYNASRTQEAVSRLQDLFGDILPVKITCDIPLHATLCCYAADLRGLSEMMMDTVAEPELLHRLMAHIRDGVLQVMRQVEETGLLTPNNKGGMYCSEPVGEARTDGRLTCANLWCNANSQEFDQVSPAMWGEFLLNYQKPIFERFGLTAYGCCENLTHKMEGVLSIPNLRIFVCSAWTDLNKLVDRVGRNYVIMWRQKASDVVFAESVEQLRSALEDGARRLQGCYYQIVLRELQTLAGHPKRLHEWTRCAIEAAEKFA